MKVAAITGLTVTSRVFIPRCPTSRKRCGTTQLKITTWLQVAVVRAVAAMPNALLGSPSPRGKGERVSLTMAYATYQMCLSAPQRITTDTFFAHRGVAQAASTLTWLWGEHLLLRQS